MTNPYQMNFEPPAQQDDLLLTPTEDGLAKIFVARHSEQLRYIAKWGHWYRYRDGRWQEEATLLASDLARAICRETNQQFRTLRSAKTIGAVERIARADRQLAATVEQWDKDLWLLNTPGGMVDLRTGIMRSHRADDYVTKITAVAPDRNCPCPLWNAFLKKVTDNNDAGERITSNAR
jgi:putative DNA primase/helicase